tara:strand:- start:3337 stop:4554 length:1218 start_codon:yes stop_codon:yes gene_type:complete
MTKIGLEIFIPDKTKVATYIKLLFKYSIFITLPITLYYTNIIAYLIHLKDMLLPFIISMFLIYKIPSIQRLKVFIRYVTYYSIFYSFFSIFEFLNKIFGIFPSLNFAINSYASSSGRSFLTEMSQFENFSPLDILRPIGLDSSFTATAFVSASGLLILLTMGQHIFRSKYYKYFFIIICYIAVVLSTSRQIIMASHITMLTLIIIIFSKKVNFNFSKTKKAIKLLGTSIIMAFMLLLPIIPSHYYDFLTAKDGGGTGPIIIENIKSLPENMIENIINFPIQSFFGIGAYTPDFQGIYKSLAHIDELHFLLDVPYTMGFLGFFLYWFIIYKSIKISWKTAKHTKNKIYKDIYITGVLIGILFIINLIHYSPVGIFSCFFVALIPLIAVIAQKQLQHENRIMRMYER